MFVPINLNTAGNAEMLLVPGVGERIAHEFEEYRPYTAIAQWRREMGKYVDDAEIERMARYVFVPIDLNTATEEEILAIPGVGKRMAHEFEGVPSVFETSSSSVAKSASTWTTARSRAWNGTWRFDR